MTEEAKVSIRLYPNDRYGYFTGKGKINKVLFTGSVDAAGLGKWFIDLATIEDCEQAFSIQQFSGYKAAAIAAYERTYSNTPISEILVAQPKRIETKNGKRKVEYIKGLFILDSKDQIIEFSLSDPLKSVELDDCLRIYGCKENNHKNTPAFFASNFDHSTN